MRRCGSYFCEEPATWKTHIEGDDERDEFYCDQHMIELETNAALWDGEEYEWQEIEMRGREPR